MFGFVNKNSDHPYPQEMCEKEMLFLTDLLDHGDGNIVDTENLSVIKKLSPVHGYYCYLFLHYYLFLQFFAISVFSRIFHGPVTKQFLLYSQVLIDIIKDLTLLISN